MNQKLRTALWPQVWYFVCVTAGEVVWYHKCSTKGFIAGRKELMGSSTHLMISLSLKVLILITLCSWRGWKVFSNIALNLDSILSSAICSTHHRAGFFWMILFTLVVWRIDSPRTMKAMMGPPSSLPTSYLTVKAGSYQRNLRNQKQ